MKSLLCVITCMYSKESLFVFLQLVVNFAMLQAEMKLQNLDTPSYAMLLVNGFQMLWVVDGIWHEVQLI